MCGSGGTGRHTILRGWRRKAWGFKSPLPHQASPYCAGPSFAFLSDLRRKTRGKGRAGGGLPDKLVTIGSCRIRHYFIGEKSVGRMYVESAFSTSLLDCSDFTTS